MRELLVLLTLVTMGHSLVYGPCHESHPVPFDYKKWTNKMYVNIMSANTDARCMWVNRNLVDNDPTQLGEEFHYIENGNERVSNIVIQCGTDGRCSFSRVINGIKLTLNASILHFTPPGLDCHYVCSDDPPFKDKTGTLFCEGKYPDPDKSNAQTIKDLLAVNGFSISDLKIVDNCNCTNIPYDNGPSKCMKMTVEDYFDTCDDD